jgi:hypothetical protein
MPNQETLVKNKSQRIRDYLEQKPRSSNKAVVAALSAQGLQVTKEYVAQVRRRKKGRRSSRKAYSGGPKGPQLGRPRAGSANFPRHSAKKALRIPRAILDQNAGRPCTSREAASFVGVKPTGSFDVEVASATKFGWLNRLKAKKIEPSDLAKKVLRPKATNDELDGLRQAVLQAPTISDVYKHYRGENIPDEKFFKNTVVDTYGVPEDKFEEFKQVFYESLEEADLLTKHGEKLRVTDVSHEEASGERGQRIRELGKSVTISPTDSCFVVQPFKPPFGDYYEKVYKPAIEKAGLRAVRADADIFGTGKIIDQIWRGIKAAKVLVAELTSRNANVLYELGLAHALQKPVVLVSSNEPDVPFDLQHIRVIYYDVNDPFWGQKLVEKVAENILSAIKNPEEAIFKGHELPE